ncbi:MAG: bifunctional DNA primase/polymerase, partial [Eggerthellaceae bacterium]|nr:bifunctional DNA primase/polymerase [Eggerthellaceae bacterium]
METETTNNRFLDAALQYIDLGMSVVILGKHSKETITAHTPNGLKDATRDKSTVEKWWTLTPKCNIGMVCGARSNGIVIIDVDNKHGVDGYETMRDWELEHGDMPETVTCCTPTGGYHFYYRVDREIRPSTNDAIGVDVRGDDSYAVLPPSVHPDTLTEYVWENAPDEFEIAEANELVYQFIEYVRPDEKDENGEKKSHKVNASEFKKGGRNNQLYKMACSLMAQSW